MPLVDIEISSDDSHLPGNITAFIREADSRVDQFVRDQPIRVTGFVPSNFVTVYRGLQAIAERNLATGPSLCEWGSGFGVVSSLAAMLDFDVRGIEIDGGLIDVSRKLAEDFALSVQFIQGSFIPSGAEAVAEEAFNDNDGSFFWLETNSDNAYEELGLEVHDFDVIFAYPWPGEDDLFTTLFEQYAADGALLLMFDALDSLRLIRKVG